MHQWRILSSDSFEVPKRIYGLDTCLRGPQWAVARSIARANRVQRWQVKHGQRTGEYYVELFKAPHKGNVQVNYLGSVHFEVIS